MPSNGGCQRGCPLPSHEPAESIVLYYLAMEPLREKIGQMILVGCQRESLTRDEQLIFAEYPFSGVILFERNCAEPAQMVQLCRDLWHSAELPPFIAIDQEGGRVHRLPRPFTHFPAAARIGEKNNPGLARSLGRAAAEELKLVGINLNFAPVLDVDSNPANPVIGDRAFGSHPKRVIEISAAWRQGLRDGGVIPCGKHFPGHGDTDQDPHFESPIVRRSLEQLESMELPPFAHACRTGIESLMSAHVIYPALDAKFPATLSEPLVTGLLRHQLGYDGVVFSDDMEMNAISARYSIEEATLGAVLAGVDLLLYCHKVEKALQAFELLRQAVERDATVRVRVEASHRRVIELKRRYLHDFTGVAESQIVMRLDAMGHQRLVEASQGNL